MQKKTKNNNVSRTQKPKYRKRIRWNIIVTKNNNENEEIGT